MDLGLSRTPSLGNEQGRWATSQPPTHIITEPGAPKLRAERTERGSHRVSGSATRAGEQRYSSTPFLQTRQALDKCLFRRQHETRANPAYEMRR